MHGLRCLADIEAIESVRYSDWAGAATTTELLHDAARAAPAAIALRYVQSADDPASMLEWRFDAMLADVRRAANLFRSLGVARGDPVALLAPNTPAAQIAFWGAQLAGCVFPINYLLNAEHQSALLRAAGARVVVTLAPSPRLPIFEPVRQAARDARVAHLLQIDPDEAAPAPDSFQQRVRTMDDASSAALQPHGDDTAALFHTGGTTGLPKLLRHTHRNEVHTSRAASAYYDFGAGDSMLNGFPLFHVAGAFVYGLGCLAAGGSLLLPTLTGMRNVEFVRRAWTWIARAGVTHLGCVPTVLSALLNVRREPGEAAALRVAMTGGSPLPNELALRFERAFGLPVRNIFGMTECAGIVSIEPVGAPRAAGSVGWRLPYSDVVAVPLQHAGAATIGRRCAPGETGVIAIRGPHVSPGYLDASRNAGTFTGDGWLLSGDLGHVGEDGRIYLTGRAKDLIIRSSHNIDPAVIEDAFLAHPAVAACAAVGEPDAYAGELPVAFVTLVPGRQIDADALLAQVAPAIPEPPAVPKRVTIVEQLPLTPIGKVYKPALRARAAERKLRELADAAAPEASIEVAAADAEVVLRIGRSADSHARARLQALVAELPIAIRVVLDDDVNS